MHLITDSEYIKQKWIKVKGERGKSKIVVGYFSIPLSMTDRKSRQKITRGVETYIANRTY